MKNIALSDGGLQDFLHTWGGYTTEAGVQAYRKTAAVLVESYCQRDRSQGLINRWSSIHSTRKLMQLRRKMTSVTGDSQKIWRMVKHEWKGRMIMIMPFATACWYYGCESTRVSLRHK